MNSDMPPPSFLRQVIKNCPNAAELYWNLWEQKNGRNQISINFKDILVNYCIDHAKFRKDISALLREGLLSFSLTQSRGKSKDKIYNIELIKWSDLEHAMEDYHIC